MDEIEIVKELADHGNRLTTHDHEIRDLKQRQDKVDDMVRAVTILGSKQEIMEGDVKEIKEDVKSIKEKPGKRWDGVVEKMIFGTVGILIGWLLKQVGVF